MGHEEDVSALTNSFMSVLNSSVLNGINGRMEPHLYGQDAKLTLLQNSVSLLDRKMVSISMFHFFA